MTVYVVNAVPVVLRYPYYEAHGLAILAFANRELAWSEAKIEHALVVVSLVAVAVAVALRFLRRGSPALTALAAVSALVVVTWSMTTQVYAAEGERTLSRQVESNLPRPFDWVDRATGGKSVVVLGQQISDPTGVQLTEFFNRSIRKIWSLDGTAINVGAPILTPDLNATDGTLTPSPDTQYALGINGVNIRAPVVARRGNAVLYKLDGPIRLRDALIGRESDGWIVGKGGEIGRESLVHALRRLARRAGVRGRDVVAQPTGARDLDTVRWQRRPSASARWGSAPTSSPRSPTSPRRGGSS